MVDVRQAVKDALKPGYVLRTPDRIKGTEFRVECIGPKGVKVNKLRATLITWEELEGVVECLRGRSWVKIGAVQQSNASGDTIEGCLRSINKGKTMKSLYVAPILEAAGIVTVCGDRPNSVTLRPEHR